MNGKLLQFGQMGTSRWLGNLLEINVAWEKKS